MLNNNILLIKVYNIYIIYMFFNTYGKLYSVIYTHSAIHNVLFYMS